MARFRPRRVLASGLLLTLLWLAAQASAQQAAEESAPGPNEPAPPSPQDLGYGPNAEGEQRTSAPGGESGVVERDARVTRGLLVVPRAVLVVPETVLRLGTEPVRLLMLLEDRHHVVARLRRFFFNDAETFGIFPTFFFETGFGANVGLRVVHRDLLGRGERLNLRAGFGGPERQVYTLGLDSGDRLEAVSLRLDGGYAITNRSRFYTVGNRDEVDAEDVAGVLDARDADVAVRTRYIERSVFAATRVEVRAADRFGISVGERIRRRGFGTGSATNPSFPWITEVYAEQSIVGFEDQVDSYSDVHAHYEDTRSDRPLITEALPTRGVRIDGWGGYQRGIGSPFRLGRVGADVQGWIPLFGGDRVLRVRLRMASVIGEDAQIPFVDLPTLGGRVLLRGYPRDRFRDRTVTLSTIEYQFPVLYRAGAYVFVDAGRAFYDFSDFADGPLRVGFGGGFVAFKQQRFLTAIQVASSRDGGVYLSVNFTSTDALGDLE